MKNKSSQSKSRSDVSSSTTKIRSAISGSRRVIKPTLQVGGTDSPRK